MRDIVTTSYGQIRGLEKEGHVVFAGIPYAKPPVGELRFAAPVEPDSWEGVRDCTTYGAPSLQYVTRDHVLTKKVLGVASEDCLYLNVRTPAEGADDKLPVYIYIHGGAYETGGSNMPAYQGIEFAKRGVVYVNINYRLGVFGALALDSLYEEQGTTGNYQLQDAFMALKWVHENIAAFGGNPNNVTIGGQSAGAFIVSFLMQHKPAAGLFKRAILQSGAGRGSRFLFAGNTAGDSGHRISQCREVMSDLGLEDTAEGLKALRELPAEKILECWYFKNDGSPRGLDGSPILKGLIFEEELLPDPENQYLNDVDLLFGFNTDEGSMFAGRYGDERTFRAYMKSLIPGWADDVCSRYGIDENHSYYERMSDFIGMSVFKASMFPYARELHKRGRAVYGYHFDYLTDKLKAEGLGVRHIAELSFVFGLFLGFVGADDEMGHSVSDFMIDAWCDFIKYGNPAGLPAGAGAGTEGHSYEAGLPDRDLWKPCWQRNSGQADVAGTELALPDIEECCLLKIGREIEFKQLERADEIKYFDMILSGKQRP